MNPVERQYNAYPYPRYSLLARPQSETLCHLTLETGRSRAGFPFLPQNEAKILLLGSGTFEPAVFGKAHRKSSIVAVDLSRASIRRAKLHCLINGITNVTFQNQAIEDVTGQFDFINSFGVLHHLREPQLGFRKVRELLKPQGLARIMVYSAIMRRRIFSLRDSFHTLGFHEDLKSAPSLAAKLVGTLPESHPLRAAFVLFRDAKTKSGLIDGFFHAQERAYTALELRQVLEEAGLEIVFWQNSQIPTDASTEDTWTELAYLESTYQLSSNFVFWVRRKDIHLTTENLNSTGSNFLYLTHPLLKKFHTLYSPLIGGKLQPNKSQRQILSRARKSPIEFAQELILSADFKQLVQGGFLLRIPKGARRAE